MISFFTRNLLWTEGRSLLIMVILLGVFFYFVNPWLLGAPLVLFIFFLYFFRCPKRFPAPGFDENSLLSPADGKVVTIHYDPHNLVNGYAYRVSIFLSPFDVHVNWTPCKAVVENVIYKPGKFVMAFLPKSSELNERNDVELSTRGGTIMLRQIAGTLARRICCWVKKGDTLKIGDTFGMIKFSSRVDLFLPAHCSIKVKVGDRVYAGHTVVGRFNGSGSENSKGSASQEAV